MRPCLTSSCTCGRVACVSSRSPSCWHCKSAAWRDESARWVHCLSFRPSGPLRGLGPRPGVYVFRTGVASATPCRPAACGCGACSARVASRGITGYASSGHAWSGRAYVPSTLASLHPQRARPAARARGRSHRGRKRLCGSPRIAQEDRRPALVVLPRRARGQLERDLHTRQASPCCDRGSAAGTPTRKTHPV